MKRKQGNPTRSLAMVLDCSLSTVRDSPKENNASCSQKRSMTAASSAPAADKAEEIRASLDPKFPSVVKIMIRSSVSGGFWLGLPSIFCSSSLPKKDTKFTLVDEDGEVYTAKYLPQRLGLSGGWKGFAIAHNLVKGDALVFHLVEPTKFKVYIVRAHPSAVVDDDDDELQNMENKAEGSDTDGDASGMDMKKSKLCHPSTVQLGEVQQEHFPVPAGSDHSEDHSSEEAIKSVILEGPSIPSSIEEFKKINNLESFTVTANDLTTNSEIPEHVCIANEEESFDLKRYDEVMNRKRRVRGEIMKLEQERFRLTNNSVRLDRERMKEAFDLKRYNE
ncbi:B3 domain-containing protein Os01g0234100-like isoform X1 [Papaver somniferum]|uniref:B3 domain-containing protein Os01g0234100-like isoform X1 n=1 Tax=Papaver somniferum TaxID=3469 RepID=UPI000E6F4A36|nr:B3 domain-containing protein Os01g0234100-like isoform X1 [Papaver somniferum]